MLHQMLAAMGRGGGAGGYTAPSDRIGAAYTPTAVGLHKSRCVFGR